MPIPIPDIIKNRSEWSEVAASLRPKHPGYVWYSNLGMKDVETLTWAVGEHIRLDSTALDINGRPVPNSMAVYVREGLRLHIDYEIGQGITGARVELKI